MSTSVTQERPRRRLRKLVLWGVLAYNFVHLGSRLLEMLG